jgi:hypothetical protein
LTDVMDAVDGGRSRRLPVLVPFGVGEGAVSAEISGWARTSPRCTTRTGPGAIIGCCSAGVARSCRTFSKTVVVITAKIAGRKVFGLATVGVRLA